MKNIRLNFFNNLKFSIYSRIIRNVILCNKIFTKNYYTRTFTAVVK